jgi:hypothetical protein
MAEAPIRPFQGLPVSRASELGAGPAGKGVELLAAKCEIERATTSQAGLHQFGQHSVKIADDGKILVKSGDWLGKYSMAIYRGDASKVKEFGRMQATVVKPVINVNIISAGETIYHIPTYDTFRTQGKKPVTSSTVSSASSTSASTTKPAVKPATATPAQLRQALLVGKTTISMLGANFAFGEKLAKLLLALTGMKAEEIEKQTKSAKRAAELIECIVSGFECMQALEKGETAKASAFGLISVGSAWSFLPEAKRNSIRRSMKSGLGRSKWFQGLETCFEVVEELEAVGDLCKIVACLGLPTEGRNERQAKFDEGTKGLMAKINTSPGKALPLLAPLAAFIARLIPEHTREKLLTKMAGEKVPVVGTIIVGIWDIVDICRAPNEAKSWAALGATAAGLVPGAGTAVSAAIDIAVLVMTATETIRELMGLEESVLSIKDLGLAGFKA